MSAILCSFSGAVADLSRKDQRDPMKVLSVLAQSPRVSVWDMETCWRAIKELQRLGYVTNDESIQYPWCRYPITEAGRAALKEQS